MELKSMLAESLNKEYHYRIKVAADCNADHLTQLEKCLQKYDLVGVSAWRRTPIQENPVEFVRAKGVRCISEVCTTDVTVRYPVNNRILEVWVAVALGIDPDRIIVHGVKEAFGAAAEAAAERVKSDRDRQIVSGADISTEVTEDAAATDENDLLFGEEYNAKFLATLAAIKKEKGADYFRSYPSKDQIMGDNLRPMWDDLNFGTNMGQGHENKEVDIISQAGRKA